MKAVVTRKGVGPALIRGNGPRASAGRGAASDREPQGSAAGLWAKLVLVLLGFAFALIVAHPILNRALSPATPAPLVQVDSAPAD